MKLTEIAKLIDAEIIGNTNDELEILALNSLKNASNNELSYCDGVKNISSLKTTKAIAVLVNKELLNEVPDSCVTLVCENPHLAFAILSQYYAKPLLAEQNIQPLVSPTAKVMPNVYIGQNVQIGDNSIIMAGVYIGDNVKIGQNCIIHPNVVIYNDTIIGNNCHLLANCVIGSDGFGYAHTKDGKHIKIYHNGNVILEDFVEIGACTTVDRGVFESTIIKKFTKIDNLVQVGHNCQIGEGCLIVSQTGLAGSSILGRNVVMGGQSATSGHIKIGDFAQIAARGGATKDLPGNKKYAGVYPIMPLDDFFKLRAKMVSFFKKYKSTSQSKQ